MSCCGTIVGGVSKIEIKTGNLVIILQQHLPNKTETSTSGLNCPVSSYVELDYKTPNYSGPELVDEPLRTR
jgi:hypothetical protein